MKTIVTLSCLVAIPLLFSSCSTTSLSEKRYNSFKKRHDYRKTRAIYRNESLVKTAHKHNTQVRIDLSDQRAQMLVNNRVALDFPCCTGKAGKRTPTGNFCITSKIRNKRSTIFGRLYRKGRLVYGGDRRKYRGRYDRYVGASLPYWMRITSGGIGMHYSGYVHRYPGSNGCIRMPRGPVQTLFAKTRVGTPVQIIY